MKQVKTLFGVKEGDLIVIEESFAKTTNCKYGLVIRSYLSNPPPSTHLKRTMLEILKYDGTICKIPISHVKKVYRNDN